MSDAKIRLYVDHPLVAGQSVPLSREQAHYLFSVMRLGPGAAVALFNGRDGEWRGEVAEASRKRGLLRCVRMLRALERPPDLWLLFAPIKKARTDFIVEKAAEMGTARILPVQTEFTNSGRIQRKRLQAHAVEAAEQCGGTFVPEVAALEPLERVLAGWSGERRLMVCDEALVGEPVAARKVLLGAPQSGKWAIVIGPEGGFSPAERARFAAMSAVVSRVSLGPRILRADTAAVAAMALWQSTLGDWR